MSRPKEDIINTSHFADIQKVISLKTGEFHVIDQYKIESFRVTFINFLHRNPKERFGVRFRSIRVSKDKVYYFRVNISQKMGTEDDHRIYRRDSKINREGVAGNSAHCKVFEQQQ